MDGAAGEDARILLQVPERSENVKKIMAPEQKLLKRSHA